MSRIRISFVVIIVMKMDLNWVDITELLAITRRVLPRARGLFSLQFNPSVEEITL